MNAKLQLLLAMTVATSAVFVSCKDDGDEKCKPATTAIAGPDQTITTTTTSLAGNEPTSGKGIWSVVEGTGGMIDDINDPTSDFTGVLGNEYTLRWTITGCPESSDDVVIKMTDEPTLTGVSQPSALAGQIITITGVNFTSNYQGNSQIIARKPGTEDTYLPIISFTATEIKAVMATSAPGTYDLVYWQRETAAAGQEFSSVVEITLNTFVNDNFYVGPTLSATNITKGSDLTVYTMAGGFTLSDYQVKLLNFNYTTGVSTEYDVVEKTITDGANALAYDELVFTVPADLPSGEYKVKVTNKGTAIFIAGYSQALGIN